jgi:4-diphosphocytidyl-2-C-methyl-D-erythritol kinase
VAVAVRLLAERAPAKINVYLRIVGRRADGNHLLDSVFLPIDLADRVTVEIRTSTARAVTLKCDVAELADARLNLASRAASAFLEEFDLTGEVRIELAKNIPAGAGLGGGSSDAGAVLRALARLFRIDAPQRLARIAASIGADVPFFLDPRPARVRGIGEQIAPLADAVSIPLVIALPPFPISTASVFKALTRDQWSGAAPDAHAQMIAQGEVDQNIAVNDLTKVAASMNSEILRLIDLMKSLGARAAAMSGSGSSVFGVFADADDAYAAARKANAAHPGTRFIATRSLCGA